MSRANQRHGPSIIFVVTIVVFFVGFAFSNLASADQKFEKWIVRQKNISIERMMKNISPAGTKPGTVIASPSREAPNYYFHWIRDASLTINTVVGLAENSKGAEQSVYLRAISDFISLSAEEQNVADFQPGEFPGGAEL